MTIESLSGKTALVVDDSVDNRLLITKILAKQNIAVEVAENGSEALKIALIKPFDFILMDIQMPVMDGYEASRQLRSAGYTRPIIAITAHAMKEDRKRCLEAGCDEYLSKPIQFNTLVQTLSAFSA